MKIVINEVCYLETTPNSFDLFEINKTTGKSRGIGYFTHLEGAIRKAIMISIDRDKSTVSLQDFIVKWEKLQREITDKYKEQQV